jgi:TolB-like protein
VLPFRALDPADASLVDAIWDDTRGAISHNPNLRVLGREAVSKLAKEDLSPTDYRRKIGADYLLDGSVEHVGDQVRMKLSLVRTTDGVEVWSDEVGGKLDDVFSFQQRIASEVEGRIRGRVAPGGGTTAKNIATTGEVYALYAEAKAKVRKRDADDAAEAATLLRKAVAMDPNYAPAWAELGLATFFSQSFQRPTFEVRPEAIKDLRRALILAPNLGYAHAALAMVQNFPPESEGDLRRAIALDPGNAEAWAWLGNLFSNQNRLKEALEAENHAVEIEPMLWTAVGNKLAILTTMGDESGVAQELARIERLRDPVLLAKARGRISIARGHPGEAIRIWLELRRGHPEEAPWVDQRIGSLLIELGFIDEGVSARKLPLSFAAEFRGTPVPALVLDRNYETPMGFWQDSETLALYGRLLPNNGRVKEYVTRYKRAFGTADDFMAAFAERSPVLQSLAPTIVCNLQAGGDSADADAILRRVEPTVLSYLKNGPPTAGLLAQVGFYEAAAGQDNDAVRFLAEGVSRGALPDGEGTAIDIAQEPCFAHLANRADFQAIRRRIFARLAEERGKVPQPLLAQIYPVRSKASA